MCRRYNRVIVATSLCENWRNPWSFKRLFRLVDSTDVKIGGKKPSPIYGKLLYDNPASVPETKAPAKTVISKRINEIIKFFLCNLVL